MVRIRSVQVRIMEYLNGSVDAIPEFIYSPSGLFYERQRKIPLPLA